VDREQVAEIEAAPVASDRDRLFHRVQVGEHSTGGGVCSDGFEGRQRDAFVRCAETLDERRPERLGSQQRAGEHLEIMPSARGLDFAERGGCSGDRLGGAPREGLIPVADRIGNERVEAERLAVPPGAVAATLPEAFDEFGQRGILSSGQSLRKNQNRCFRKVILVRRTTLRNLGSRSLRKARGSRPPLTPGGEPRGPRKVRALSKNVEKQRESLKDVLAGQSLF
jgi:hypothetical protein